MCRFVFYLGPKLTLDSLITRPEHSLVRQSFECSERGDIMNADGFGVSWFVPELSKDPAVFRSISPAWSNRCLADLCRVTQSHCILAHVRAASPGLPVMEANCHPFSAEHLAFMHNGYIPQFKRIKRALIHSLSNQAYDAIQGSTDSEHTFALFRDFYRNEEPGADGMGKALHKTITRIVELCREADITDASWLNLAVSNGQEGVVSRFSSDNGQSAPSLYLDEGRRYHCEGGVCRMLDPEDGGGAIIVSSERLSEDPGWHKVDPNTVLVIHPDHTVEKRPITL